MKNAISMVPPLEGKQFEKFEAAAQEAIAEFARDTDPEVEDLDGAERSSAEAAIDKAADEAVMKELNQLEWLLGHSTWGDWVQSPHSNDAVIVAGAPSVDIPDEMVRAYGGNLVFESARLADREFILALRRWAPGLLAIARGHEAEKLANDMLVKALITNEAARNSLHRREKFLEGMVEQLQVSRASYRTMYSVSRHANALLLAENRKLKASFWSKIFNAFKRFSKTSEASPLPRQELVLNVEEFLKP